MTTRTGSKARWVLASAVGAASLLLGLAGCPDNPYKAETWIEKLGDSREAQRAITELDHLGDPKAIPALSKAWERQGKAVQVLQVIIDLARPLTKDEAKAKFLRDFPEGRPSNWDKALPVLKQVLTEIDDQNARWIDSAIKAADAIGDSGLEDGIDVLIETANRKLSSKAQRVRLSAVLALGKFKSERVITALSNVLRADLKTQEPAIFAAAVNALADMRSPAAVPVLIETMYRIPGLFGQIRRALVASGPAVAGELRKILRGEQAAVNTLFKEQKLDKYCGDKGERIGDECESVSAKDFYAAVVLGDLYDPESVDELLAALKRPALPVYFQDDQPSPNTQYNAIFDALRKIGSSKAAASVKAVWANPASDAQLRTLAVGAYAFVSHDSSGAAELGKIADTNDADAGLRQEAATAFARLTTSDADVGILTRLADKYAKASGEQRVKANAEKPAYDAAKKASEDAKKAHEAAKGAALKASSDRKISTEDIKKATAAVDEAKKALDAANEKLKAAGAKFKPLDGAAKDYRAYQRMFQTQVARIEIAMRCKGDPACYAKALPADFAAATLAAKADEIASKLGKYIPDLKDWTPEEKRGLVPAQIERAMLELGKMGNKAEGQTATLLEAAKSEDRIIRQSILLALPKVAKLPCKECETKLDAAIKAGEGKTTLGDLNVETIMLRNYFSWAGTK